MSKEMIKADSVTSMSREMVRATV